jgi:hypothetical protein
MPLNRAQDLDDIRLQASQLHPRVRTLKAMLARNELALIFSSAFRIGRHAAI